MKWLIFTILFLLYQFANSQEFKFIWKIEPSFESNYSVIVEKERDKQEITIKNNSENFSINQEIILKDCQKLFDFLSKYKFLVKSESYFDHTEREYLLTTLLPDTNWVIVIGDTIRKRSLFGFGYYFDRDSNKCYQERKIGISWTDGTFYKGILEIDDQTEIFNIHNSRLSNKDIELNNMILEFIKLYDERKKFLRLVEIINYDLQNE